MNLKKNKVFSFIAISALIILLIIFLDWALQHFLDGWQNPM
ncbi:hypothetical protein SAMN04488034_103142 [Salinimicrobium catena]|uniref:Uncharacterized protein n=1 Tax=Salinimicrobium catena TaxID=390640 RepID=A0A1H5MXH4_9FLAO|nr:hypothetical protein SAMN04488140_103142 [Salinimicrobium catena]SEE93417.1 hypothetical protein SAMN04488034_103142 [Salinimicrobium catena]